MSEETRLKPVNSTWRFQISWMTARLFAWGASVSIIILFGVLFLMWRDKPLPHMRTDSDISPQLPNQISAVQEKLKANPQDLSALVELGTLLFEKGRDSYVEAIGTLEDARDLGALDPRIFYCLGIMYQEEGLYPFALTEYQRFLRHYPDDKEIRLLEAKLYYKMGMFQEAIGEYDRLKFSYPSDPLIEENLGLSLWDAKQFERALASFNQLKTYEGDYARRAEYYLGQMAFDQGHFEEAADHYTKSGLLTASLPGIADETAYSELGATMQKLQRFDEAKVAWDIVVKANPKNNKAAAALREVNRRIAQAKKAAKKS